MSSYIVTGGNRGLGRAIVSALAERVDARIVLAVRDPAAGERAAAEIGQELGSRCRAEFSIEPLDLASRSSVEAFIARWQGPIAGLVNNAGVQFENDIPFNDDGLELTFAVNHLHALRLSLGLIDRLDGGRVIWIGSGTHNPRHPTASRFGFRGERFVSIEDTASGLEGGTGKDRYATSKFLNLATTVELARRFDPARVCISCLDPGLMPGTDLARTAWAGTTSCRWRRNCCPTQARPGDPAKRWPGCCSRSSAAARTAESSITSCKPRAMPSTGCSMPKSGAAWSKTRWRCWIEPRPER
jgi:NAD(P)-dependent dehydrogenase (short-subunit alcohol dehydrogenase family)